MGAEGRVGRGSGTGMALEVGVVRDGAQMRKAAGGDSGDSWRVRVQEGRAQTR